METETQRRIDFGGRRRVLAVTPPRSALISLGYQYYATCQTSWATSQASANWTLTVLMSKLEALMVRPVTLKGERMLYDMRVFH